MGTRPPPLPRLLCVVLISEVVISTTSALLALSSRGLRPAVVRFGLHAARSERPQLSVAGNDADDGPQPDWREFRRRLVQRERREESTRAVEAPPALREWMSPTAIVQAGSLLVAQPRILFLSQPMLQGAVLLVVRKNDAGTLAIAMNRPSSSNLTLATALRSPSLRRAFMARPLHAGGTQLTEDAPSVWMITTHAGLADAVELAPGVWCGNATEAAALVNDGVADPDEFHFFAGHFCWENARLQHEIDAGAWAVASCSGAALRSLLEDAPVEQKHVSALKALENDAPGAASGTDAESVSFGADASEAETEAGSSAEDEGGRKGDDGGMAGTSKLPARKLVQAMGLWKAMASSAGADGSRDTGDGADAPLELDDAIRQMHAMLSDDEAAAASWRSLDAMAAQLLPVIRPPSSRLPYLPPWLDSLARWGLGRPTVANGGGSSSRYAVHTLRMAVQSLLGGGGARAPERKEDLSNVSLLHLLQAVRTRGDAIGFANASEVDDTTSSARPPLGGELSTAMLTLLLARRLGIDADLLITDAGWFLRAQCGGNSRNGEVSTDPRPSEAPDPDAPLDAAAPHVFRAEYMLPPSALLSKDGADGDSQGEQTDDGYVYMRLAEGEIGALISTDEMLAQVAPASVLLWGERPPLGAHNDFVTVATPIELACQLASAWADYFAASGDGQEAAFWKLQLLVLERLGQQSTKPPHKVHSFNQLDVFSRLERLMESPSQHDDDDLQFGI